MHPLNFAEASKITAVQMEETRLFSPACAGCLDSFRENARLVLGIAAAPGFSGLSLSQWTEACTKAALKIFGRKYSKKLPKATAEQSQQHWLLANKYMASIVLERQPNLQDDLEGVTRNLDQIAMRCGPYIHGIFEGLLKTVCVQAWGAIEVLFEELLTKTVEENAAFFPHVDSSKFYFRKLDDGTRKWYKRAFNGDAAICSLLNDESFSALAELRHILVHKAGQVDEHFQEAIGRIPALARFSQLERDARVSFDGQMVYDFVQPAISKAYSLIAEVDNRINILKQSSQRP